MGGFTGKPAAAHPWRRRARAAYRAWAEAKAKPAGAK